MLTQCGSCFKVHDQNFMCEARLARKREYQAKSNRDPKIKKFRSSQKWVNLREYVVDRDGGCVLCKYNDAPPLDSKMEVHHIEPLNERWDLRLEPTNLCTLCFAHHNMVEGKEEYKNLLKSLVEGDEDTWVV